MMIYFAPPSQDQLASYDVNGNDHDPTPRYDSSNENKWVGAGPPYLTQAAFCRAPFAYRTGQMRRMTQYG